MQGDYKSYRLKDIDGTVVKFVPMVDKVTVTNSRYSDGIMYTIKEAREYWKTLRQNGFRKME
jgi:hypothetical protein